MVKTKNSDITLSMRELDRLKIVQAVLDGLLKPGRAAERLKLTDRQFRRLVQRYRLEGAHGLLSRHRGRRSNNRTAPELEAHAAALIRERYADFGPTLACEKLVEVHGLVLAKETVRRLMIEAGLWVPRKQRPPKIHQPRNRRACVGELIQIDGCEHAWFELRGPTCTALVYVDDATSRLMEVYFTTSESTFSYFGATRAYVDRFGKPAAFYSDKAGIFRVNSKDAKAGRGHTQFARALYELNIEGICANSGQAKGRVERAHLTLQDRLVKELRLRNISTLEAANAFMPIFIKDYNARFARHPRSSIDAHRAVRSDEGLDHIFVVKETRCVSKNLTLQYDKVLYMLQDTPLARSLEGIYIDVFHFPDGRIEPRARGQALPFKTYDRLTEIDQGAIVDNKRLGKVLEIVQLVQAKRDNRRSLCVPVEEGPPRKRGQPPGKKPQLALDRSDLNEAIRKVRESRTSELGRRADISIKP